MIQHTVEVMVNGDPVKVGFLIGLAGDSMWDAGWYWLAYGDGQEVYSRKAHYLQADTGGLGTPTGSLCGLDYVSFDTPCETGCDGCEQCAHLLCRNCKRIREHGRSRMAKKKPAKKPTRGSGVSITLPTEPLAGAAKTAAIMAVMVQDDGVSILEYEIKEGQSIEFRVGGTIKAFMERVGDAPDGDMFMDADREQRGAGDSRVRTRAVRAAAGGLSLQPGQRLSINPVVSTALVLCPRRIGNRKERIMTRSITITNTSNWDVVS